MESANADYILINHGANDRGNTAEVYVREYIDLIRLVRARNKDAVIISLSAFCGVYPGELEQAIMEYNRESGDQVYFIDSTGWIPAEPLHPLRDGHEIVSDRLSERLKELWKKF